MRHSIRFACAAAICAVVPVLAFGPATAAPTGGLFLPITAVAAGSTNVESVQYRRRDGRSVAGMRGGRRADNLRHNRSRNDRRHRSGRNSGRNLGIGLGAAIIGGALLSRSGRAAHRRTHASAWARCERAYNSFEPSTGMYTGYDGVRRLCRYLR